MNKITRDYLKRLIAEHLLDDLIEELFQLLADYMSLKKDTRVSEIYDSLILISGKLKSIRHENLLGIIDSRDYKLEGNKIGHSLILVINGIPEYVFEHQFDAKRKHDTTREKIKKISTITTFTYDVFLSFSSKDVTEAKALAEGLRGNGLRVFISDEVLKSNVGTSFFEKIDFALNNSKHFILLATFNSMESEWVKTEYETFYNECYIPNKISRKFIVFKGASFDRAVIPLLLKRLQFANSITELLDSYIEHEELEHKALEEKRQKEQAELERKALEEKRQKEQAELVRKALEEKRQKEQAELVRKLSEIKLGDYAGFMDMGLAYYEKGEYDQAIACYKKVAEVKPDKHEAFFNMGLSYDNKAEYDQAIECYKKAVEIKPDYHQAFYDMGLAYYKKEEYDQAIACYKKVLEIKPDDHQAFYIMGIAYADKGEYDQEIACYKKALEIKPDYYEAFYLMGLAYDNKGKYDQAIACYKKALEIKPDDHEVLCDMGIAYDNKGDYDQAIECYQKAVEIKPDDHEAFYDMGHSYDKKGDYDQAIACYKKVVEINPNDNQAFYNMGHSYYKKGESDHAITCYQKALEIKPDDLGTLLSMGWSNLLLWKFEIAKSYLQKVWKLSNNANCYAAMNLGHISLLREHDSVAAILWYKNSIALYEDSNSFFDGMESDFADLQMEKLGINKEDFDLIINELKSSANEGLIIN